MGVIITERPDRLVINNEGIDFISQYVAVHNPVIYKFILDNLLGLINYYIEVDIFEFATLTKLSSSRYRPLVESSGDDGTLTINISSLLKPYLNNVYDFDPDVENNKNKESALKFFIKYREVHNGSPEENPFITDETSTIIAVNSVQQIDSIFGQNVGEFVPLPYHTPKPCGNILTNGDFNSGITGWTAGADSSIAAGGAPHEEGAGSMQMNIDPTATDPNIVVFSDEFVIVPNTRYEVRAWVKHSGGVTIDNLDSQGDPFFALDASGDIEAPEILYRYQWFAYNNGGNDILTINFDDIENTQGGNITFRDPIDTTEWIEVIMRFNSKNNTKVRIRVSSFGDNTDIIASSNFSIDTVSLDEEHCGENQTPDRALFLSAFKEPVYFKGWPFSLSYIYPEELGGVDLNREEDELDASLSSLATSSILLDEAQIGQLNFLTLKGGYADDRKYIDVCLRTGDASDNLFVDDGYVEDGYIEVQ